MRFLTLEDFKLYKTLNFIFPPIQGVKRRYEIPLEFFKGGKTGSFMSFWPGCFSSYASDNPGNGMQTVLRVRDKGLQFLSVGAYRVDHTYVLNR